MKWSFSQYPVHMYWYWINMDWAEVSSLFYYIIILFHRPGPYACAILL